MKKAFITIVSIIILLIIVILAVNFTKKDSSNTQDEENPITTTENQDENTDSDVNMVEKDNSPELVIGKSVTGKEIKAYRFGTGEKELIFVGGVHGGYSWNTALVAYQLMDYLKENPTVVPEGVKVTVVPVLNPDGLSKVVSATGEFKASDVNSDQTKLVEGRFNGNNVDLNRNFDCDWQTSGKWQQKTVSGGKEAFSEPETSAIKNYIESNRPVSVVVWYSAAGGVYSSSCHNGVSKETSALTNLFAKASGYKAYESFDFYEVTGDMVNWLAKNNIPAISVLLTNHTDTEWSKNKAGIDAILNSYKK